MISYSLMIRLKGRDSSRPAGNTSRPL